MISRYSYPDMTHIWDDDNRFQTWLLIELYACEAQCQLGVIPKDALKNIKSKARFDVKRILEIEDEVHHDVIAFLTAVAEHVGPDARFIHLGMTSSDVLDTALAYQTKQAGALLVQDMKQIIRILTRLAKKHRYTVMMGRSHGIHAEPVTFGLKMALFLAEAKRNLKRLETAIQGISFGKISGAVGTFAHIDPYVEKYVCQKMGLSPAPISTQILQRDRHAEFMTTLAIVASSLDKIATEIRHLQRTEVYEAEEGFAKGQKGSSAMPHKRNPILCERISGQARILRAHAMAALENIPLWHERDISHSSVERVIFPDGTILLDYMLRKMAQVLTNLNVYPKNMRRNIDLNRGLICSQQILLALIDQGCTREHAYRIVQEDAMKVWTSEKQTLYEVVSQDARVTEHLNPEQIESCFDMKHHLRHVNAIIERVIRL